MNSPALVGGHFFLAYCHVYWSSSQTLNYTHAHLRSIHIFFCIYDKLMFWPSSHLINFTHAHLHVIHMDINWISTKMRPWCMNSTTTCMPWSWYGVQKVWDLLVGPSRKTSSKLALRQTRMVRLVHGACGGMHEMTPTFGSMWAWPMCPPPPGKVCTSSDTKHMLRHAAAVF